MADFVELGAEGINHLTDRYFDSGWDKVANRKKNKKGQPQAQQGQQQPRQEQPPEDVQSRGSRNPGRHRNELPEPEPERDTVYISERRGRGDDQFEYQSETSERVNRAYENERDDPVRPVDPRLERQRTEIMSQANGYGYAASGAGRTRSQQPPKNKYWEDEDSDYDEREGRRYKTTSRGYYEERDDYQPYDREIVETERYRGPARPYDARRVDRSYAAAPYAAGAVAPYRRSQNDVSQVSRRERSQRRSSRYERDDSRSSRSRSSSRGRGDEGWKEKVENAFDTSIQGVGVGIAGAVVGGLAGREFGNRHQKRDMLIGAVVGGLGANAAENQWKEWKEKKDERREWREERYEGNGYGRSRSGNR